MICNLEFRKFKEEKVEYTKEGKSNSFERKVASFEDEDGDQLELRFKDLKPFEGVRKGQQVVVSFKVNDKGLVCDARFVSLVGGPAAGGK